MAPRLIRGRPLAERIRAYLNPFEVLLRLSEELDTGDWDHQYKEWANSTGFLLNLIFLIARANSGYDTGRRTDDVFGDDGGYTNWFGWLAAFIVHLLSLLSITNAAYTLYRQRRYRLFESSLDAVPSTPSAHRVRVDSSPLSSSPIRFLSTMLTGENSAATARPDATRDVWEIAVWDPTPLSLRMFCLFSPGNVLIYWLLLPIAVADPRPSVTVLITMLLAGLLTGQLLILQKSFSQQSKDVSVVQKEVMNEYNTKYVHPRTRPLMRDVGTQLSSSRTSLHDLVQYEDENDPVDVYTPTYIINRGFQTRPNPSYVKHVDTEGTSVKRTPSRGPLASITQPFQTPAHLRDISSPAQPQTALHQPHLRAPGHGDGGNLGIFSHANSPLHKAAPTSFRRPKEPREGSLSPQKGEADSLKKGSLASLSNEQRWGYGQGMSAQGGRRRF